MKKTLALILSLVLALSAFCVFAGAEDESKTTNATFGTPVVDGDIDTIWETAEINKLEIVFANDEITEPSTCRFRVMYDEFYLYFLVEVTDTTMGDYEWEMNGANKWWNRDGVAFCFAPDGSKEVTDTQVAPAFWYIIRAFGSVANYNGVAQNVFVTEKEGADSTTQNDFEKIPMSERMYAITLNKDAAGDYTGYVIECKVNLKARYEEIKMEAGTKIGFEMNLNDNNPILMSASRNYGLVWNDPTVVSYKDNSKKGTIILADKSYKAVNTDEAETTATPTTEEITTAKPVETTAKPVETTAEPVVTTEAAPAAEETTAAPAAEATTEAPKTEEKSGCGSSAAAGIALILMMGCTFVSKKH